jgi:hypothetical protein
VAAVMAMGLPIKAGSEYPSRSGTELSAYCIKG